MSHSSDLRAKSVTRASVLSALVGGAFLIAAPAAHATRNEGAEAYVQTNASAVLQSLASASASERQRQFTTLMNRFADVPRIANFVLGRYGPQLQADAALRREWITTFQAYALAVYQDQLDRYRGTNLRVTGSIERVPGRDVIVRSEMAPRGSGRPLPVQWRILRSGEAWRVVDVSLVLDGNEIWLAQQQQRDFLAQLDRTRGDLRALIASVRQTTASLQQRARG